MSTYTTPYVYVGVNTDIYSSGDALGAKATFDGVPSQGVIMTVNVVDRDSEAVNLDLVMFDEDIAGTAANAAFAPTDAELSTSLGSVLVDTWKAFSTNSLGTNDNVGLAYATKSGTITFQCVTRGTPTYTAATDLLISITVVF
jgi:hypothetical protein